MQSESWGSRFGFLMASAGFAIGLGNIWRFPYLVGDNGGGAFLLVYLIIIAVLCVPLLTMELSLGRKARHNPVQGMRSLTQKGNPWVLFGWFGVLAAFFILTYYIQIMGWILIYLFEVPTHTFAGMSNAGFVDRFESTMANGWLVGGATLICIILVGLISARGLEKGVEAASKIFMPLLFLMLIVLAIRSLTLEGSGEGLEWYLSADFSQIDSKMLLTALGQSFFSIGIASGAAFVYGSYLQKGTNIPKDVTIIIGLDTLAAVLAGLVIFPAIFSIGLEPDSGAKLLFVSMSNLFEHIPAGAFFGALFFLFLFMAAITSAIGYLEPVVKTVADLSGIERTPAVVLSLAAIFIVGIPNILAHGVWSDVHIMGMNFFDFTDYLSGNILMPLGALTLALYTALVWKFGQFQKETNVGADGLMRVFQWWHPLVTVALPVILLYIFITGLF